MQFSTFIESGEADHTCRQPVSEGLQISTFNAVTGFHLR